MIELTPAAIEHVRRIQKENQTEGQLLRISVAAGGCSGFTYELFFEQTPTADDQVFDHDGVRVAVDPMSLQYLDGTRIDYVQKSAYEAGFQFENPQVTSSCGCGKSFSTN